MNDTPASPSPNVSEDGCDDGSDMATDNDEGLLAYTGQERENSGSSNHRFEHV